jgi:hypothetical protein
VPVHYPGDLYMRHRASRPLIDLWRRLPRAAARLLGEAAKPGPVRALVAMMMALSLGTGAYAAVASVIGGSSNRQAESAGLGQRPGPTASRDGERPRLTNDIPTSDGRAPTGSDSEPGTTAAEQSEAPSPATGVTPSPRSKLGRVTGSPSTGTATPSTSPSQPSATASTPEDLTPPNTSLSEEFPAGDAARFSFSANEPASFTCSLDGAAYTSCDSPTHYSDLHPGWHTFAVRATDAAGNVDPSPAEVRWHARDGRSADQ